MVQVLAISTRLFNFFCSLGLLNICSIVDKIKAFPKLLEAVHL